MTSVPKPLKFLSGDYGALQIRHKQLASDSPLARELADVLSWLGMTLGAATRDSLHYKLIGTSEAVSAWGHEYVRHLCLELGAEWAAIQERAATEDERVEQLPGELMALVDEIVPFLIDHNAEHEACDLLLDVEQLDKIVDRITVANHRRIALYLLSCAAYLPEPEDTETLRIVLRIYAKLGYAPEQLRLALALDDAEEVASIYAAASGPLKSQLAIMLGEHGYYALLEGEEDDTLQELMGNVRRCRWFQQVLAKDLDILEPKLPDEIYKEDIAGDKKKVSHPTPSHFIAFEFAALTIHRPPSFFLCLSSRLDDFA